MRPLHILSWFLRGYALSPCHTYERLDETTRTFKNCVAVQPQTESEVISLKVPAKLKVTPLSTRLTTAYASAHTQI